MGRSLVLDDSPGLAQLKILRKPYRQAGLVAALREVFSRLCRGFKPSSSELCYLNLDFLLMLARDGVGDVEDMKASALRLMRRTYQPISNEDGLRLRCWSLILLIQQRQRPNPLQGLGPKGIRGLAPFVG